MVTSAKPNLSHLATVPCAGSPAGSHRWGGGTRSWVCHQALEDWSSVQAGAVLGAAQGRVLAALTGVSSDQGSQMLLWPLPAPLFLQPIIEGFVSLKSRFLTSQIIFKLSPQSAISIK